MENEKTKLNQDVQRKAIPWKITQSNTTKDLNTNISAFSMEK